VSLKSFSMEETEGNSGVVAGAFAAEETAGIMEIFKGCRRKRGNIIVDQTIDGGNRRKLGMFTNVSKLLVTIGAFLAQRKKIC